ncbi:MAG: DinB family protein [Pseudomonadales bacterium]
MLISNFNLMAQYNKRMNQTVYEAASPLSAESLAEHRGAYFGSVIGTLNHIYVCDVLWLKRFAKHAVHFSSLDCLQALSVPTSLDAMPYADFSELWRERVTMDATICRFAKELSNDALMAPLSYHNVSGEPATKNFAQLLQHFFNHQTHHRGQLSTLLSQLGIDIGVTDLLAIIPDSD